MAEIIRFPRGKRHARAFSATKKSGRIFSFGIPVSLSIWKTRTSGTPRSTQRVTVDLSTEHLRAKSACLRPFSANRRVSDLIISAESSCTTHNPSQGSGLRKPLTTEGAGIGMLAAMSAKSQKRPVEQIYAGRQPRRPHYIAKLMERRSLTRADLIEKLEVDKSQLSRWLDEDKPSTPSSKWAKKLGLYFRVTEDDDLVDIFADPDVDWMTRFFRGRSNDEIERMKTLLEAAFPVSHPGKKVRSGPN